MRHARGYRRLNRTHEHRKAMFSNMAGSLIEHEQIKTTLPKAKELRPIVEKMITLAKRGDLHARRLVTSKLKQDSYVKKLFDVLGPRYKDRNGGYVRILKAGFRLDNVFISEVFGCSSTLNSTISLLFLISIGTICSLK